LSDCDCLLCSIGKHRRVPHVSLLRHGNRSRQSQEALYQGTTSVVPKRSPKNVWALQAAEKLTQAGIRAAVLKGHDFNRAKNIWKRCRL
jgi:hypothetical protein